MASTSAQTWNRNWRTPSCTGTSLSILRSSIVYWIASVSRCSTCCASDTPLRGGLVLVLEVVLEELLELGQHGLEHAPAGVGVGLDHLHDALDLLLQRVADGARRGVEAHHAGAHAVDQAPRRVVDGGEEVGLADRHAQHRHLQPREPDAHRRPGCAPRSGCSGTAAPRSRSWRARPAWRPPASAPACAGAAPPAAPAC